MTVTFKDITGRKTLRFEGLPEQFVQEVKKHTIENMVLYSVITESLREQEILNKCVREAGLQKLFNIEQ